MSRRMKLFGRRREAATPASEGVGIPSWNALRSMSSDELAALAARHGVDFNGLGRMKAASELNRKRNGQ